jgi:hypothetical protein
MVQKFHAGSGLPHGHQNKGTERKPSPFHGGSGRPKGVVHDGTPPRQYGLHGGTALPMGTLSGKKRNPPARSASTSRDYAKYSKGK